MIGISSLPASAAEAAEVSYVERAIALASGIRGGEATLVAPPDVSTDDSGTTETYSLSDDLGSFVMSTNYGPSLPPMITLFEFDGENSTTTSWVLAAADPSAPVAATVGPQPSAGYFELALQEVICGVAPAIPALVPNPLLNRYDVRTATGVLCNATMDVITLVVILYRSPNTPYAPSPAGAGYKHATLTNAASASASSACVGRSIWFNTSHVSGSRAPAAPTAGFFSSDDKLYDCPAA